MKSRSRRERLALAGIAFAWIFGSGLGAAVAQDGSCPLPPLEQRLGERWRWRTLEAPGKVSRFIVVRPWVNGGLIALDDDGLIAFDGYQWQREPGWERFQWRTMLDALPGDDGGVIAVLGTKIVSIDAQGELHVLRETENPARITRPCRLPDGSALVGIDRAIVRIDGSGLHELFPAPEGTQLLSGLVCDPLERLWICTESGLFRRLDDRWEPVPGPASAPAGVRRLTYGFATGDRIHFLPTTMDSRLRGFTWDGVHISDFYDRSRPVVLSDATATPGGELIIALGDSNLRVFRDGIWHDAELPQEREELVQSLCLTSEGRLAVVFGSGELAVCDLDARCWQQFDPASVGVSPVVNALAPARAGGVWIGTGNGIARWDGRAFVDVHRDVPGLELPLFEVTTLCEDGRGRLWVGSGSGFHGAACLDGNRWTLHEANSAIGRNYVHRVVRDGDDLWFMLLADADRDWEAGGMVRLRGDTFTAFTATAQGDPLPRCYDIARDANGTLVAGTLRRMYRFNDEAWEHLPSPFDTLARPAWSLFRAKDGDLLVGSGRKEAGVQAFGDGRWRAVESCDGRRAAAASFCQTADGKQWFASALGLFLMDEDKCHDVSSLLPRRNIWPILADDATGGMWLGTLGSGLGHFRPADTAPPRTSNLEVVQITPGGDAAASWTSTDAWNQTPPDQVRCRVFLDGRPIERAPPEGRTTSRVREFTFEDLEVGPHRLEVVSIDNLDNAEKLPEAYDFTITAPPPPLLFSAPVLMAAGLILGAGAWLVTDQVKRRRERVRAEQERAALAQRLSELTLQLLSTQEDERRKLSRELHDNLGQICTALCIDIQRAARLQEEDRRSVVLDHALGIARDMLDKVRRMSFDLRPLLLDDHGLPKAVAEALTVFTNLTGVDVQSDLQFSGTELPREVTGHVYRILQEALTNVARHACAHTVDVRLHTSEDRIELSVSDDGTGFDADDLPPQHHFGLLGMRERAELMGGSFRLQSSPHGGTAIHVSIPTRRSRAEGDRDEHSGSDRHG